MINILLKKKKVKVQTISRKHNLAGMTEMKQKVGLQCGQSHF